MCRFVLYLGHEITLSSLVTEPVNSIIHQSFHSHERAEPLNGDGFGVAWYRQDVTPNPVLFKDITPAWNNQNLLHLAPVIQSACVLAHVRAATPGLPVIQLNCHPFSWGPFAFMHNGTVAGFESIRRALLGRLSDEAFQLIRGSTDSEHLFALFADQVIRRSGEQNRAKAMLDALSFTIKEVEALTLSAGIKEPSYLNIAVTDGSAAVVSHYASRTAEKPPSLYVHTGSRYVCRERVCEMVQSEEGVAAVMIASEPLSEDEGWAPVAPNSAVVVQSDLSVEMHRLPD